MIPAVARARARGSELAGPELAGLGPAGLAFSREQDREREYARRQRRAGRRRVIPLPGLYSAQKQPRISELLVLLSFSSRPPW